jgi:hypothetical protein
MVCLSLFLFREHPAKIAALSYATPSFGLSGFLDAFPEGGRLIYSRIFFTLNVASLLLYMTLVSLKLGAYTDYTFELSKFAFVTSSMVCSTITTLLVFGFKNVGLSFYRPGSLVVLVSAVCCLFLDADTLAVMKMAYSLQGQTLGKHKRNKTVERQLKKHKKSIMEAASALMLGSNGVAPAPAECEQLFCDAADCPDTAARVHYLLPDGRHAPHLCRAHVGVATALGQLLAHAEATDAAGRGPRVALAAALMVLAALLVGVVRGITIVALIFIRSAASATPCA